MSNLQSHNPTSEQIYKVAGYLRNVDDFSAGEQSLDMGETRVNKCGHVCGSVHCHFGWYAVAKNLNGELRGRLNFVDGGQAMAEDLGFKCSEDLRNWVHHNPDDWGNDYGRRMAANKIAFYHPTKRPAGAETLSDIIDHWKEVGDRVKATEEATK